MSAKILLLLQTSTTTPSVSSRRRGTVYGLQHIEGHYYFINVPPAPGFSGNHRRQA